METTAPKLPAEHKNSRKGFRRMPPHPQDVWLRAWVAAATACGCKTPEKAGEWADAAYQQYLIRWQWNPSKEDQGE